MNHKHLRRTALKELTVPQFLELGMQNIMHDIRMQSNITRLNKTIEYNRSSIIYLIGRLHGLYFGSCSMLLYKFDMEYDRLSEMFESFRNEAEFLIGAYQQ